MIGSCVLSYNKIRSNASINTLTTAAAAAAEQQQGLTAFCFFFGTIAGALGSVNTLETRMKWLNLKLSLNSCTSIRVHEAMPFQPCFGTEKVYEKQQRLLTCKGSSS